MINFKNLPQVGQPLEGGIFAGLTTTPTGEHCAVVLLADEPETMLTWKQAMEWAASIGGELPMRPVSALLFANLRTHFETNDDPWYWTGEQYSDRYAWIQFFDNGSQTTYARANSTKGVKLRARAVRLVPVGIGQEGGV